LPSRKEIHWSQLKVGALVLAATAVLIGLIFVMSGSKGGVFTKKIGLRVYFDNASGLKDGAPVTLEGVTIGNVVHVRVVPDRNPTPVEVTMRVSRTFLSALHTDSTATITQAGVLGDSFLDIDSTHATGPEPHDNAELRPSGSPTIQDVIRTSNTSIQDINALTHKLETLIDALNSKLVNDDTLYTRANTAVDKLSQITSDLEDGKGTVGKLLKDESLYNNLNSAVSNANQLITEINQGKGALGKISKDPAFAQKLDDTVSQLDAILKDIHEGKGTLGQLAQNRSLYDHTDQTADNAQLLLKEMRENPKKYLVIRLKLF
jgi:phospholipid/cholesterol/gamma-HCH transport system substrate-binding protein